MRTHMILFGYIILVILNFLISLETRSSLSTVLPYLLDEYSLREIFQNSVEL